MFCVLELVLPKHSVQKSHLQTLLKCRLGFLTSGVEPEILHLWQAPRHGQAKRVLCPPRTIDVVPCIWTHSLKHRQKLLPQVSHKSIPGRAFPPCPTHAQLNVPVPILHTHTSVSPSPSCTRTAQRLCKQIPGQVPSSLSHLSVCDPPPKFQPPWGARAPTSLSWVL